MKKVVIAFDCDGTLIQTVNAKGQMVANERIRTLLITLASFKNTKIIVWSGGGELWARQVTRNLGIEKYVDNIMGKNVLGRDESGHPIISADITPDIAIDDIQSCTLGVLNLIVREK